MQNMCTLYCGFRLLERYKVFWDLLYFQLKFLAFKPSESRRRLRYDVHNMRNTTIWLL